MDNAHIIRDSIESVFTVRSKVRSDPKLHEAMAHVKRFQAARFSNCYTDLIESREYGPAARFFLDELYGDADYSSRDAQFARIAGTLTTVFPASVVSTAVALARLHALTEQLDYQMACQWMQQPGALADAARYRASWKAVGRRADRVQQLDIALFIGLRLSDLTRKPGLGTLLKLMRRPAASAGLASLQLFLEQGFAIFGALSKSKKSAAFFLETVQQRESDWINAMFEAT